MMKEIRLSFYFTDELVFQTVLQSNILTSQIRWAEEFYKRYEYKLSLQDRYYTEKELIQSFVLAKEKGFLINFQYWEVINELLERYHKANDEYDVLLRSPQLNRVRLSELLKIINETSSATNALSRQVNKDCIDVRTQINMLSMLLLDKKMAPPNLNNRIVVIFCFSKFDSDTLKGISIGNTSIPTNPFQPFILIPIGSPELGTQKTMKELVVNSAMTLAHEIVHAAGHSHPPKGGEKDGPPNSIMNYAIHGKNPSEVILEASHIEKLNKAFFVV